MDQKVAQITRTKMRFFFLCGVEIITRGGEMTGNMALSVDGSNQDENCLLVMSISAETNYA